MPLTLTLKPKSDTDSIVIGDNIRVTVSDVRGNRVRVSVDAPRDVLIYLESVLRKPDFVPANHHGKRQYVR